MRLWLPRCDAAVARQLTVGPLGRYPPIQHLFDAGGCALKGYVKPPTISLLLLPKLASTVV